MFYLFAYVNFLPNGYDDWQAAYDDLAAYVWKEEKSTQTYYFGIPFDYKDDVSATDLMFAFEVYDNRDGLYQTHFKSAAMGNFTKKALPVMSTGFDLAHYSDIGGFLDAPGDGRQCGVMQDIRIICKSPEARKTAAERLVKIAKTLEGEPDKAGVQTWMAFESVDNDLDLRVFGRFENQAALQKLNARKEIADFWIASRDNEINRIDQRNYVPNDKGWLHR